MTKTVHVVGGDRSYEVMFRDRGYLVSGQPLGADLLCFTGGADVNPELYGHAAHPYTGCSTQRDAFELSLWGQFRRKAGVSFVGICRGAQFLNVMNGGTLFQHCGGHAIGGTHDALERNGTVTPVTSTHHQMMIPGKRGDVILTAVPGVGFDRQTWDPETSEFVDIPPLQDVEALHYAEARTLCFQPHPEMVPKTHPCQELFFRQLSSFLRV